MKSGGPQASRSQLAGRLGLFLCGVMIVVLIVHKLGLVFNVTPSMPLGFYRATPIVGSVARGEIVQACLPPAIARLGLARGYTPAGSCPSGVAPILKIAIATGGDLVELGVDGIRVNHALLPGSKRSRLDGRRRPMSAFRSGPYILKPDEVWLWTPYPGSWDSRYWGPLRASELIAKAQLVFALQAWPYATRYR